jgi:hypothetical protein
MSRISLTEPCAAALEEARWDSRAGCVGDLLAAALDGNKRALKALAKAWPADTSGPRTRFIYVRAEVLERLAELAGDAAVQPARGPSAPGLVGITELLRRAS